MDAQLILQEFDKLLEAHEIQQAEEYLVQSMEEASSLQELDTLLILTNEAMGFYRESGQNIKSIDLCYKALDLLELMGLQGTIPYATTLINIANAHRAAGLLQESLQYYKQVLPIYSSNPEIDSLYIASLHNNISLLYQEMGEYRQAKEELLQAYEIVRTRSDARFEHAVTLANLANTCIVLSEAEEAFDYANKAIALFEEQKVRDSHYSSALAALGSLYYQQADYEQALLYFSKSRDIIKENLGTQNQQYQRVSENLKVVQDTIDELARAALQETGVEQEKAEEKEEPAEVEKSSSQQLRETIEFPNGLALCESYFDTFGRKMLEEQFPEYENQIAAGLFGKGSDCFGFDDEASRDHDFGPRFVLLVRKEVYDKIGEKLQKAYEQLPSEYYGIQRQETFHGRDRAGVFVIEDYFTSILGTDLFTDPSYEKWLMTPAYALAAATNGKVFYDPEGIVTAYREKLMSYYPEGAWYRKLAQALALFSQSGQYNFNRMLKRNQLVSAALAKADCMREAMHIAYLLLKKYAPHDKWLFKGLEQTAGTIGGVDIHDDRGVLGMLLKIVNTPVDEEHRIALIELIEELAILFADELTMQNVVGMADVYLDANTTEIMIKSNALMEADRLEGIDENQVNYNLSKLIARMEFEAFDKVQNEGGRASCQDNWPTFKVMRMSQYLTWNKDMLLQYIYDFKIALSKGRNMIEEKYARMMQSTAPQEYAKFEAILPSISEEKRAIMEEIIRMQVEWMENFALRYPNLAKNARYIHTSEDDAFNTSYETYLRGELGTYSDRMLELYGRYIVEFATSNRNVAEEVIKNTVQFYGYTSFEEANEKLNL